MIDDETERAGSDCIAKDGFLFFSTLYVHVHHHPSPKPHSRHAPSC